MGCDGNNGGGEPVMACLYSSGYGQQYCKTRPKKVGGDRAPTGRRGDFFVAMLMSRRVTAEIRHGSVVTQSDRGDRGDGGEGDRGDKKGDSRCSVVIGHPGWMSRCRHMTVTEEQHGLLLPRLQWQAGAAVGQYAIIVA